MSPDKPNKEGIVVAVPGTGWPEGDPKGCSTITQALMDEAERIAVENGNAPIVFVGGAGAESGSLEGERARIYYETAVEVRGEVSDVLGGDPTKKRPALYTDCDPDFPRSPSRNTEENGANLAAIVERIQAETKGGIGSVHVVSPTIQAERAVANFRDALRAAGLDNIEVEDDSIDVEYEPGNAQSHWRSEKDRRKWEMIRKVYDIAMKFLPKGLMDKLKEKVKKKAGLT